MSLFTRSLPVVIVPVSSSFVMEVTGMDFNDLIETFPVAWTVRKEVAIAKICASPTPVFVWITLLLPEIIM